MPLDRGACTDVNIVLVIGSESWNLDGERVKRRRQFGKAKLSLPVCRLRRRTTNERRRSQANGCAGEHAALRILDSADERTGDALRRSGASQHYDTGCGREHHEIRPRTIGGQPPTVAVHDGSAFAWPER